MLTTRKIEIITRLQRIILAISLLLFGLSALTLPAHAQTAQDQILSGIDEACIDGSCASDDSTIHDTVVSVINIVSAVVGTVSIIMVIIGGLKYTSSQGDSSAISSAKNTIVYAVVGIVIVVLSQVIVRFVVARANTVAPPPATPSNQDTVGRERL